MHVPVIVSCVLLPPVDSPEYDREEVYHIDEQFMYVDVDDDLCRAWNHYEHGDDGAYATIYEVDDYVLRQAALDALPIPAGKEGWEVDELQVEVC